MKAKTIVVIAIVLAGIWYFKHQRLSHASVFFQGVEYKYNDTTENNGVVNYFFTIDSERPKRGGDYIQLVDLSGINLSAQADQAVKAQITSNYNLREVYTDHFFGRFRNSLPIFMIKRPSSYVIYFNGANSGKDDSYFSASLREEVFRDMKSIVLN